MKWISFLRCAAAFAAVFPVNGWAVPYEVEQSWHGQGVLIGDGVPQPAPIDMTVTLKLTGSALHLEDCWKSAALKINHCNVSDYTVDATESVYDGANKIGDVYAGHVVTFIGKAQVSEQMVLDINSRNQLNMQYNFAAYDGVFSVRQGLLDPVATPK